MEEWKEYRLGEITVMKNGKKRPQEKGLYPVYGGNGIMDYSNDYNSEKVVIVGRVGAYCGCVYKCDEQCWVSDNAIAVSPKDTVDFHFLYYLMSTLDFHYQHIGGAQPLMTQDIIGDFKIKLPSFKVQQQIVSVLKSLDDKIEVNRRINDNFIYQKLLEIISIWKFTTLLNDNLEQQAQALFKSWFVDFEPFKDGEFVESELGMIPKGWRVSYLGNVTTQTSEKVKNRTDVKVLSPITSGELVLSEEYFTKQVFSESIAKYIIVRPNDFAYNPARVNIGSIGMNKFDFDGCVSPVYVVFHSQEGYHHFFDLMRRTSFFKEEVRARSIGGVRQTLSYKDFSLIKTVYPPKDVIEDFNKTYEKLMSQKEHNLKEISILTESRDTLLPKLMSGELKINIIDTISARNE